MNFFKTASFLKGWAKVKRSSIYFALVALSFTSTFVYLLPALTTINKNYSPWSDSVDNVSLISREIVRRLIFLSPVPRCYSEQELDLVIIVISSPQNFAARRAIRSTWGSDMIWTKKSKVFFLIGRSYDNATYINVSEEQRKYHDIIHYNFADTYFVLTIKSLLLLKWVVTSCSNARYIMKADDDMYINVPLLLHNVLKFQEGNTLFGYLMKNTKPIRKKDSKWYISYELYPEEIYPNYLAGFAYVMGKNAAFSLYNSSRFIKLFPFEDIFITGMCAQKANLVPRENKLFQVDKLKNPCKLLEYVTSHGMSPKELYDTWYVVHNHNYICVSSFWDKISEI